MRTEASSTAVLAIAASLLLSCDTTSAEPPSLAQPNETSVAELELTPGCLCVIAVTFALMLACFLVSFAFKSSKKTRGENMQHKDLVVHATMAERWIGDPIAMQDHVEAALENERYMRVDCLSLYLNRPWRQEMGPAVAVTQLCSNAEWMGWERFPAGRGIECGGSTEVLGMSLATWRFLWRRTTESSRKCFILGILEGLCPAASSMLLACLVATLKNMSGTDQHAHLYVLMALAYGLINFVKDRCHYRFLLEIPCASVRQKLRQRLQYEFLRLQEAHPEAWPSGRCMATLERDVRSLVKNVWASVFFMAKQVTEFVSLVVTVFWQTRGATQIQITLGLMYLLLACGSINNMIARKPNLVDMAKRKRDWALTMFSAATRQVHESSHGHLCLGTNGGDNLEAATFFGKVATVYRQRSFHLYFVRLMSGLASKQMMVLAQAAVMVILGFEVIKGRMSAGGVVGTFSAMGALTTTFEHFSNTWLNLVEGYPSLLCIAHIFNQGAGFSDVAAEVKGDMQGSDSSNDIDEELGSESSGGEMPGNSKWHA